MSLKMRIGPFVKHDEHRDLLVVARSSERRDQMFLEDRAKWLLILAFVKAPRGSTVLHALTHEQLLVRILDLAYRDHAVLRNYTSVLPKERILVEANTKYREFCVDLKRMVYATLPGKDEVMGVLGIAPYFIPPLDQHDGNPREWVTQRDRYASYRLRWFKNRYGSYPIFVGGKEVFDAMVRGERVEVDGGRRPVLCITPCLEFYTIAGVDYDFLWWEENENEPSHVVLPSWK